tara:strand:+ start:69 stop:572 length:504 start_codon:yes stop_codon:yes gene_type:complete
MRNTKIKIGALIFLLFFFNSCGFKPMYKISESRIDFKSYSIIIVNESNISREIKEEIRKSFPSSSEVNKDYVIEINTTENLDPLITNTDGTVAKYRIEIVINFKVKGKNNDSYLIEDVVRGFAQYTVETSEIESDDKKKRMIRTATSSAIQMMISKIQSDASMTNDN